MISKKLTIINKLGLHARASMKLVNLACRYQSEITMKFNNSEINVKSIMNLMSCGASCGSQVEFLIEGDDQNEAMAAIDALINDRFGEQE